MPDDLHHFLSQRAPGRSLGMVLVDRHQAMNGSQSELISTWLNEEEKNQLSRYSFEKRRTEWFLGRICAKQSTMDLLDRLDIDPLNPLQITIAVGPSGRPYLQLPTLKGLNRIPDISISHSHDKVIGLAGNCRCGIDVQLLTDTLFKVSDRFCSDSELALLNGTSEDELVQLGMLWVAKEAIRKSLESSRPAGFLSMHLNEVRREQRYWLLDFHLDTPAGTNSISTVVHIDNHYCLGVCTSPGAQDHARTP
ncbi:MAG: 4'-phosphopantetheinyl transferase superfamily protein [Desulfocapsaceae bacterium]